MNRYRSLRLFAVLLVLAAPALLHPGLASARSTDGTPAVHTSSESQGRLVAAIWVIDSRAGIELEVDGGEVEVVVSSLHSSADRTRTATTVAVDAAGLNPGARYLMMFNNAPLIHFTADEHGQVRERLAAGDAPVGWSPIAAGATRILNAPVSTVQVVEANGEGRSSGLLSTYSADDSGGESSAAWTPLCGSDARVLGGALVEDDDQYQYFAVHAEGLEPLAVYTVFANGVEVGSTTADAFGWLWLDAASGDDLGAMFELPAVLLPVSLIAGVEVVADGVPVLAGDFTDPCEPEPSQPSAWGSIPLCSPDAWERFGWFDWVVFDDDLEIASLTAMGLDPETGVEVVIDGELLAAATVDEAGMLWLVFSSDPSGDEIPLPATVLPLTEVFEVELRSDGEAVLAGAADGSCDLWAPPAPVASATTPLCSGSDEGAVTATLFGEVGWAAYENGDEELWLFASEMESGATYRLDVDGVDLGAFAADEWGFLFLDFASAPAFEGQLPLPEAIRPLSAIDRVQLLGPAGTVALAGSFTEPCEVGIEIESNTTGLCDGDGAEVGATSWWIADLDGSLTEQGIDIMAWAPANGAILRVEIDGLTVGEMISDPWGFLYLFLGTWGDAPIPPELQPISGIDTVRVLTENGDEVMTGSFSDPCGDGGVVWPLKSRNRPYTGSLGTRATTRPMERSHAHAPSSPRRGPRGASFR